MKRWVLGFGIVVAVSVLMVAGTTWVPAADLSGGWTFKMEKDFRGNPGVPIDCTFNQQRTQLIVKCTGPNGTGELKGEVRGREVTWGVENTGIPPMVNDRVVLRFIGEMNESGSTVKGIWRLTSSVLNEKGNFEATRKQ